jgi:ATP-dependent helicase/nuclease subunit A
VIVQHHDNLSLDEENRKRALELSSFIVEAPAGAGKTELLTQRYLKLLQTVNEPEEIIAITFTNKAAAEMRGRILESLTKAAKQELPTQSHKLMTYELSLQALARSDERTWQLIENPSRLRIFTIDSLCAHLARQMPLLSRFGSQPKVAVDAQMLYAQAAEQTIALLESEAHGEVIKAALRYVENNANQLKDLLIHMLEKRDQWLHHAQYELTAEGLQQTLVDMVEFELQQIASCMQPALQSLLMPIAQFAASNLPEDHSLAVLRNWDSVIPAQQAALPMWCALADLLLTDKGQLRKAAGLNVNFGFPPSDEGKAQKAALAEILASFDDLTMLHQVRSLPNMQPDVMRWETISHLSQLLNLAVAQLWLVFQQAGEVDFVEIAHRASRALGDEFGEPTELALKLDYRIQHLLVDEFQDTSPSQIELLKKLTAGWQMGDGRTLFAVGDPMQSIYRFRKANVGLFIEAAESGIGDVHLERLQLYRNNRSTPAIVDWINATFAPLFPKDDEISKGAIHYRPFIATKQNLPDASVDVHPVIKHADESAESAQQREAELIVNIIQSEQKLNPNAKIAVLVRSKKHLAQLVSKLRREHRDIAFQAVEIESLAGRQVVQDLLSLTHALHHRADRVHWLAILRAPWCGLNLHDLHALAGHDHQSLIWTLMQDEDILRGLSEDGQARLRHVTEILREAFAHQVRMSTSRWVRGVWMMLNGAACLWDPNDVVDVQAFFACMDALDKSNQFSAERMAIEITKLFAAPDQHGENLQMMSIHKSKGLEFDTVILPGLGASTGGNHHDKPLLLWEEVFFGQEHRLLAAPFLPKGARDKNVVSPYDYLEAREKMRDSNEDVRVLYVAATRAVRKLHLVGIANFNTKQELSATKNSYLDLLWPALEPRFAAALEQVDTVVEQANLSDFVPKLVRMRQLHLPPILQAEMGRFAAQPQNVQNETNDTSIEADIGTLAHRYMEIIANQGLQAWPLTRISQSKPVMQHWLRERGHAESQVSEAATQVETLLHTTLNSEAGKWVLAARHEAAAELAVLSQADGEIKKHVIDRTFVEGNVRWIIDYKTGMPQQNLEAAAESHRAQLVTYAELFKTQALPVRCAILFMSLGELFELKL